MNFYKLKLTGAALCLTLLTCGAFAQTNDTEKPDTSWFTDVTDQVGLGNIKNPGGMIWLDVNNDDYPDLITLNGLGVDTGWHLYINEQRPGSNDLHDRVFVEDVAGEQSLNVPGVYKDLAGIGDFDNDGNIDIVINCWPLDNMTNCPNIDEPAKEKCRIFWGNGDGTFTIDSAKYPTPSGLEALGNLSGSGLPALDYDRDGNLDLFVADHYDSWCTQNPLPSHLLHNNGDHTFTDATAGSGINVSEVDSSKLWLANQVPSARALFGVNMSDWNNDCWPDIFTCPYEAIGYPGTATHCDEQTNSGLEFFACNADTQDTRGYGNLYENLGGKGQVGKFKDVGITANWDPHFAWADQGMVPWAAMPGDYNNDGNMDYLVLEVHGANNDSSAGTVYPNEPGDGITTIFTNLGPKYGYKLRPDVNRIVRNVPITETHGDHTGCWIDFNNDGWQDLMVGDAVYGQPTDNQRIFFEMQDTATHTFRDITHELGWIGGTNVDSLFGDSINYKIRRPGGLAPVDIFMTGADAVVKMPYTWPQDSVLILRNNVGLRNNHISIKLKAPHGVNKSCIGARITVRSGNIKQMKDVMGDQGQWTNNFPLIQTFGLGKRTMIDTIDVRWPDANCSHTILTNVPANQFIVIDSAAYTSGLPQVNNPPANNFTLYPNPDAGNTLNIKFDGPLNPFITIYNAIGQQVANFKPGYSYTFTLPINNLPAGLYFVHIQGTPQGTVSTKPFIKSITQ